MQKLFIAPFVLITFLIVVSPVYAQVVMPNGKTYVSKKYALNYFEENEMTTTSTPDRSVVPVQPIPRISLIPAPEKPRPEPSQIPIIITSYPPYPTSIAPSKMPIYPVPEVTSIISRPYSEIDILNKKIADLQKQFDESKKRQSVLEKRVNDLFDLIKRLLPFKR